MSTAYLDTLPSYISINEAGRRLGLTPIRLQDLIRVGTLKAARIKGETVVEEEKVDEIATQPKKEDLEEYKQFAHLKKTPIWSSEAARKYGVSQSTISRWASSSSSKNRKACLSSHFPTLLCHAPPRSWLRHPHCAGTLGA